MAGPIVNGARRELEESGIVEQLARLAEVTPETVIKRLTAAFPKLRQAKWKVDDDEVRMAMESGITTIRALAAHFGVSGRTIERSMDRLNPGREKRQVRPWTEDETARALEMLRDGAGYGETARSLGRERSTLRKKFPGYSLTKAESIERATMARTLDSIRNGLY